MSHLVTLPKIDFIVTNRCNLQCIHCCFRSGELQLEEFSLKKIRETLVEFVSLGGNRIDITGGEPLMRRDIDQIIALSAGILDLNTELAANSLLLSEDKVNLYRDVGLKQIAISLDGSTALAHGRIRGTNIEMFQKLLANISMCARSGIYIKINTVVFDSNLADLVNIARLAIELGASELGFYFFSPVGRGASRNQEVADPLRWLEIIRNGLVVIKDKIKLSLEVPIIESELIDDSDSGCFLQNPWHLQILPNGNVYPCAIMVVYDKPIGNLHETTLKNLWESEELWNEGFFAKNVKPFLDAHFSCVAYPGFPELIKSRKYKFICPYKKLDITKVLGYAKK